MMPVHLKWTGYWMQDSGYWMLTPQKAWQMLVEVT